MADDLTVEEALRELEAMFPRTWWELSVMHHWNGLTYWIRVYGRPRQTEGYSTLNEAMTQVHAWKESQ